MRHVQTIFFVTAFLSLCSCSDTSTEEKSTTVNAAPPEQAAVDTTMHKPDRIPPKYTVIRSGSAYADYEILMEPVDLNSIAYKQDVEAIIDDIAYTQRKGSFTAVIYDDVRAAELYHKRRELGQGLNAKETELVDKHIVAMYTKDFDGVTRISFFENVPPEEKSAHKAWKEAFNQEEFSKGYKPR